MGSAANLSPKVHSLAPRQRKTVIILSMQRAIAPPRRCVWRCLLLAAVLELSLVRAMAARPICKPVELPLGVHVLVRDVAITAGSPLPPPLLHFHDVAEIAVSRAARGHLLCEGERFPIAAGTTVFVPRMQYHDYDLAPGAGLDPDPDRTVLGEAIYGL